jgi:peptidoglycan/xylan/chitin deacetylase (PgdA/CDA1 family)
VPLLERLGLPATFFLVPGLLSRTTPPWWEILGWTGQRAGRHRVAFQGRTLDLRDPGRRGAAPNAVAELLKRRDREARDAAVTQLVARCEPDGAPGDDALFLDWDQARSLATRGFAVGPHTLHHAILGQEPLAEQAQDLEGSRRRLQDELAVTVDLLAYPNGTPATTTAPPSRRPLGPAVPQALTVIPGWNRPSTPRYDIRRFLQRPERGPTGSAAIPAAPLRRRRRR